MRKIFEGLSRVNQAALSVHDNHIVVMVTGRLTDSTLPALEAGWKAVPVIGNAMLLGHTEAVDRAVQRIAKDGPPAELTSLAEELHANSELWAIGPASEGVKRSSLTVSIRDGITSDMAFEFDRVPDANALQGGATIEGNVVHVRTSMEADEVQQKFPQIAVSPLGQRLGSLVMAARYFPGRGAIGTGHTKPVIYGLDGGPKELNQHPNR
jgi:hypothetical protein